MIMARMIINSTTRTIVTIQQVNLRLHLCSGEGAENWSKLPTHPHPHTNLVSDSSNQLFVSHKHISLALINSIFNPFWNEWYRYGHLHYRPDTHYKYSFAYTHATVPIQLCFIALFDLHTTIPYMDLPIVSPCTTTSALMSLITSFRRMISCCQK